MFAALDLPTQVPVATLIFSSIWSTLAPLASRLLMNSSLVSELAIKAAALLYRRLQSVSSFPVSRDRFLREAAVVVVVVVEVVVEVVLVAAGEGAAAAAALGSR